MVQNRLGVKQGCVLSPLLLMIVINVVLQNANSKGVKLSKSKKLSDVEFAENLTLLDEDKASLQEFFNRVIDRTKKLGMNVNVKETKCMVAYSDQPPKIFHTGDRVEQVSCFDTLTV